MINLQQELENFSVIDPKTLTEGAAEIPDNIKNSIILYNKALENLKSNNEDIAIIELKKAVAMNPNFSEAMNLLGICYSYTKAYSKASEMFEKVASIENNGIKAQKYLKAINDQDTGKIKNEIKSNTVQDVKVNKLENIKKAIKTYLDIQKWNINSSNIKKAVYIALGLILILVIYSASGLGKRNVKVSSSVQQQGSGNDAKVNQLSSDNKNLDAQLKAANAEVDYYKNVCKLLGAENLFISGNYEAAGDMLALLKTVSFKDDYKAKYEELNGKVMPKAAWSAFEQGCSMFASADYKGAIDKLSKVQAYGNEWSYMDATLYKIGICYKEINDSRNAVSTFQKIIDTYPNSQYAVYAGYRIKELTAVP